MNHANRCKDIRVDETNFPLDLILILFFQDLKNKPSRMF